MLYDSSVIEMLCHYANHGGHPFYAAIAPILSFGICGRDSERILSSKLFFIKHVDNYFQKNLQ